MRSVILPKRSFPQPLIDECHKIKASSKPTCTTNTPPPSPTTITQRAIMQPLIKSMILAVVTSSAYADMPALRGSAAADFVQELAQLLDPDQCPGGFSGDSEHDHCWIHTGCNTPYIPVYNEHDQDGVCGIGWYCSYHEWVGHGAVAFDACLIKKECGCGAFYKDGLWQCAVCSKLELDDVENSEV